MHLVFASLAWVLVVAPAGYAGWTGRRLVLRIDDPAFAELRFARTQRLALVFVVCLTLGTILDGSLITVKFAVAIIAMLVAEFFPRRVIFDESWSLGAYLSHTSRFWLAMAGIWMLIAASPVLVRAAGENGWRVCLLLGMTWLLWANFHARLFPALLRATDLDRPDLESEFEAVLEQARCRRPRLLVAHAPGGHWINAFALPSQGRPAVLFSRGLLDAMTLDETVAIFAHEVAHLEQLDRRRLILRDLALVAMAALVAFFTLGLGGESWISRSMTWIWPLFCLVALLASQSRNQAAEHLSDIRALELTGRLEPIVSALSKLHRLLAMPRRWRGKGETKESHPSLAARLRALREAAAEMGHDVAQPEPVGEVTLRSAAQPSRVVVLAADRLHWLQGVPLDSDPSGETLIRSARDCRSIRYGELSDLRLEVRGIAGRYLVAVDGGGQAMKLDLRPGDVEIVKKRIELLDLRVRGTRREVKAAMRQESRRLWLGRAFGLMAVLVGFLPPFSFPFSVAGFLVLLRPTRATLAAATTVGLAGALLGAGGPSLQWPGAGSFLPPLALNAVLGFIFLFEWIGRSRAAIEDPPGSPKRTLVVFGVLALLSLIGAPAVLASPLPWTSFHTWARFNQGLVLVLLATTVVSFFLRPRWKRWPALVPAVLAVIVMSGGTSWFHDRFGDDPLVALSNPLAVETVHLERLKDYPLEGNVVALRLSPTGRLAIRHAFDTTRFDVELRDGSSAWIEATDLAFVADDRIARLAYVDDRLVLQTMQLDDPPAVIGEIPLPGLPSPTLRVDDDGRHWEVAAADPETPRGILLSGTFGEPRFDQEEWSFSEPDDAYFQALNVNASPRSLAIFGRFNVDGLWMAIPFWGSAPLSEISLADRSGMRRLALTTTSVTCLDNAPGQTSFVCASYDLQSVTRLWALGPADRGLIPIGSLDGFYYQGIAVSEDRLLLTRVGGPPVLVERSRQRAWLLKPPPQADPEEPENALARSAFDPGILSIAGDFAGGPHYPASAMRHDLLALASVGPGHSEVAVFRLPDAARSAPRRHDLSRSASPGAP